MTGIYVVAAELSGPFSSHPERPLREMLALAAQRALAAAGLAPEGVDALYAGAMGNFDPEGFVGPLPVRLVTILGLHNADVTPMLVGSSEAGAWALRQAYTAIRRESAYHHVLVVAGEQMNALAEDSLGGDALAERQARNRAISEILDDQERRYGLNMVRIGDLFMDAVRAVDGWTEDDLRERFLPLVALRKYERVAAYPYGQLHGRGVSTLAAYKSRARLARYFNLHDATPTSSGAVALVLSRQPPPGVPALEILGMGQSIVPVSLTARTGDPRQARSHRLAIARACQDAGVGPSWLRACDFALVHDAFPSIEYFFLKELGFGPSEIVARMTSGWSNPFGGLKACGHALGASGLLQVAQAFHRVFGSAEYVTPEARDSWPRASTCFSSSVGGPMTNVVVSLLRRSDASPVAKGDGEAEVEAFEAATEAVDRAYEAVCRDLPPGHGLMLAATQFLPLPEFGGEALPLLELVGKPWIGLCEQSPASRSGPPKALAYSEQPLESGALVRLETISVGETSYLRATPTGQRVELPSLGRSAVTDGLRQELDVALAAYAGDGPR